MALINCPECSAQVSDAAPACIKCGFPFAKIADPPRRTPAAQGPRFDGVYVSQNVMKGRGSLRMLRADYTRGYIRFFQDGLLIYGAAVCMPNPSPVPPPPLHRSWGSEHDRAKWSAEGERLRIVATNGVVSYAKLDGSRLDWEGGMIRLDGILDRVFDFYLFQWSD